MSKNIYKESIFNHQSNYPDNFTKIKVQLEQVEINGLIRFVLSADVSYHYNPTDDEGREIYSLELLLEKYTPREKALRLAIAMIDDLKKRYEDYTEATE